MGDDIPLGRIAGIKVGMSFTVFLVAGFYAFGLAVYRIPSDVHGLSQGAYWFGGAMGAIFLFLSLLVHEIGHALVAREEGIEVEGMGLTLLGGITRMRSSPLTPGSEFRISVVGPVASALCGVVFLVAAYLTPNSGTAGMVGYVFAWVGGLNLLLAGLNMAPGVPLDGGRVLASAIWRASGSQAVGMTAAAASGVVIGMVSLVLGIHSLLTPNSWLSDWAFFLLAAGGFVAVASIQQLAKAPLYRALDGLVAAQAMAAAPPSAPSWASIADFLRSSTPRPEHQAYPVVGPDGQVMGLLTAAAIRAVPPQRWEQLRVADLAYPIDRVTLVHADEPLLPALQKVEAGQVVQALVVAADGQILGTLDPSAIDRVMAQRKASKQAARV